MKTGAGTASASEEPGGAAVARASGPRRAAAGVARASGPRRVGRAGADGRRTGGRALPLTGQEAPPADELTAAAPPGAGRAGGGLSRGLVLLLAVATGVTVASNYYVQPLLATIRHSFGVGPGAAGLIVTTSQIGYAAGLLLLLPLGDLLERRRLVVAMSCVTAASLIGMATAPSLDVLYAFSAIAGATSVVAQILVAFSASLARDAERGRVVGTVMSGLILGILLARTVAGYVAAVSSWRVVYFMAAGIVLVLGTVLWRVLPRYREETGLAYPELLTSVAVIFRQEPVLRRRALYGALSFGAFTVLWTSLAFLLAAPPYRYGVGTIGLFGLAGVAGAGMASVAGRLADRGKQAVTTVAMAAAMLLAFVMLAVVPRDLVVLVAGIVLLDLGSQGMHVTNQSEIYRLAGAARSRVNSAYMTCYFIGGTVGSIGAAATYASFGWDGPAGLGVAFGAIAFLISLTERRFGRRQMGTVR